MGPAEIKDELARSFMVSLSDLEFRGGQWLVRFFSGLEGRVNYSTHEERVGIYAYWQPVPKEVISRIERKTDG